MSRHRSSHSNADTNPGSVPLAPACHKSDKGSQRDGGRRPNREVKKAGTHSTDQTAERDKWQPLCGGSICNETRQAPRRAAPEKLNPISLYRNEHLKYVIKPF